MSDENKVIARRGLDPEIQAMAKLDRIMADLDPSQRGRVIQWLWGRYESYTKPNSRPLTKAFEEELEARR